MNTTARSMLLSAVAMATASLAGAQNLTTAATSGGAIKLSDGVLFYPAVTVSAGKNDNVTGVATGKISSTVVSAKPRMVAETKRRADRYTLVYEGDFTRYNSSRTDNFNNHTLEAAGDHVLGTRSRLGWAVNYLDKADPRETNSESLDTWRGLGARAVYRYGAQGAKGNLEAEYAYLNKRYDSATANAGDLDSNLVAGRYFWRVMPKTHLVAEARFGDNSYRVFKQNSNTDTRLLVGLTWDATAKTSGSVKVGQQKRNYAGKSDFSGGTYEAQVQWAPLTHSTFTLTARRSAEDSTDAGVQFQKTDSLSLGWNHQWNGRLASRVSVSDSNRTDVGATRQDHTLGTGLGLSYKLGRNYGLNLDYGYTDNDSSAANSTYKRNTFMVSLQAQL